MTPAKKSRTQKDQTKRYIPNLAEFYFKPTFDWSHDEASQLFENTDSLKGVDLDTILFEDCIPGMKRLPTESIDLVIADPPFGIAFDGKSGVYNRDENLVVEGYEEAEDYQSFTREWLAELPRVMKPTSTAYVFSGWTNLEAVLTGAREAGLVTLNHLIWHYPFGVYTKKRFVSSHYHIVVLVRDPKKYFFNKIENYPEDVWLFKRKYRTGQAKNATTLPLDVVSRCVDFSSRPGDIVLDPFMGNGTSAIAAKSNFRHFIGFEINKQLKPLLEKEVSKVELGQSYTSYNERLPSIEELSERYPKAYREYVRKEEKI
ncbi:MAG: DNA-methyltransferase [Candidatus Thorarchaeota archaeon]|jgi:site-specific DNA-methyltransferase (adenine-specific)